jgi:hypothetical protein
MQGTNDGLWDWDFTTNEIYYSPRYKELLGYDDHEFPNIFENFAAHVHPDDVERIAQEGFANLERRTPYDIEHRLRTKTGEYRWFQSRGQGVWDDSGKLLRMVGVIRDITERKQMEEALRKAEERYRSIFENAAEGIFQSTPSGQVLAANPALAHMFGYDSPEEFRARVTDVRTQLYVDPERRVQLLERLKENDVVRGAEVQLYRKDGSVMWASLSMRAVCDLQGTLFCYEGVVEDISERKKAEEALRESEKRYRVLVEESPSLICTHDLDGMLLSVNPAAARVLGYQPKEMIGKNLLEFLAPSVRHLFAHYLERIQQNTVDSGVLRVMTKDGEERLLAYRNTRYEDAGQPPYVLGHAQDITERQTMEKMKDEFVSVVSHELRTPLTSIRGSLGLLATGALGSLSEKAQRMVDIAVTNTDRLIRLINDILDVERIKSGKVVMEKASCNAADLIAQATDVMRVMAEKAEVTLTVYPQSLFLWADPDRIIQTLTNLLSNAIKFSPPRATVWLTVERQGDQILFQVKDQGRGIPSDKLERVFERFQQVDTSDSREKGGSGLGLTICRSIVQQHGGRIWVESTVGEGSTFFFTLPALKSEQEPMLASPLSAQMVPVENGTVRKHGIPRQILIVEHNVDVARVLIDIFERYNMVTYYAQTGEAAVQCCELVTPDLIVLDPDLPELDGFAVVDRLRRDDRLRQTPLAVYSAKDLEETERQQLVLGETRFFTKGRVVPAEFERRIIEWLGQIFPSQEREQLYDTQQAHSHH